MRIQPIVPVVKTTSGQNDLFNRDDIPRETIQRAEVRRDGEPMTKERAMQYAKEFDCSTVVDLNKKDIPAFLYNKDGKLT